MVASHVMRRSRPVTASLAAVCADRSSGVTFRGEAKPPGLALVGLKHIFKHLCQWTAWVVARQERCYILQPGRLTKERE